MICVTVMNYNLNGDLENFVNLLIIKGYATSRSEVIRMGLISLKEKNILGYEELSDDPELEQYLKDVKSGKIKTKFKGPIKNLKELTK